MQCYYHYIKAAYQCSGCGIPICHYCATEYDGRILCQPCSIKAKVSDRERRDNRTRVSG